MMIYRIRIMFESPLSTVVFVQASTIEEAIKKAGDEYPSGRVVFAAEEPEVEAILQ